MPTTKFLINSKTNTGTGPYTCKTLTNLKQPSFSTNITKIFTKQPFTINYLLVGGGGGGDFINYYTGGNGGFVVEGTYNIFSSLLVVPGSSGRNSYLYSSNPDIYAPPTSGGTSYFSYLGTDYSNNPLVSANGGGFNYVNNRGGYGGGNVNPPSGANGGNGRTSTIVDGTTVRYYGAGAPGFANSNSSSIGTFGQSTSPGYGQGGAGSGSTGVDIPPSAGVVIISYQSNAQQAKGGTITSYTLGGNKYWVHLYAGVGTFII